MIKVNDKNLCENCFMETDQQPCPFCSFGSEKKRDNTVLSIGSVLDSRYMIGGVLGKGGFGITYLAYDIKLEKRIAIKEYYPRGIASRADDRATVSATDEKVAKSFVDGADKFYREAELVSQFNGNPNIVNVYDFFRENDTVYFTMGFINGESLKTYISEKGNITEGQAMNVYKCMTNALLITHSMNILHRDISPDNIMLCSDGTIKLIDFGAARQVMAEESHSLSVILKQGYAPLEQYQRRGKQGPWTDIYSLGATLYTALTGDYLDDPMTRFEDDSEHDENKHGISEGLWQILRKSTMLKIEDRYQDIVELKKDLSALKIKEEPFEDIGITGKINFDTNDDGTNGGGAAPAGEEADPNATVLLNENMDRFSNATVFVPKDQVEMPEVVKTEMPKPEVVKAEVPEPEVMKAEMPEPEVVKAEVPEPEVMKAEMPKPDAGMEGAAEPGIQETDLLNTDSGEIKGGSSGIPKILFLVPVLIIALIVVIILGFFKGGHGSEKETAMTPSERTMMGDAASVLKEDGVDGSVVELTVNTDEYNEKYGVYTAECDVKVHQKNAGDGEDASYKITLVYDEEDGEWILSELSHQ